jgi:hypothetical protein
MHSKEMLQFNKNILYVAYPFDLKGTGRNATLEIVIPLITKR